MNKKTPSVDGFLRKAKNWRDEMARLRSIVLDTPLTEDIKWRQPCYTFQDSNVVLIGSFKACCVLSFMKGVLLKDAKRILGKPGENSQSCRWIKFTSLREIEALEPVLKAYILEAIDIEKAGLKVTLKKITEHKMPDELKAALKKKPALKAAFEALTPGRQRAYLLHFSAPKQSTTRVSRIEKCTPRILDGKGLND